ncbi:hypothetical protein SLV14_000219 [Streptomyces sp. Je 1-4]|uniref:Ku protein n=1 Tax=Streptomyces TaxID=1883 RepID=UPI0021D8FE04|nr:MULTISPECIES: Ku protein [unclassified Streptomyces]UYB37918.1 hypothetical protein SLV14_000219 [Streptomyces sp. Je 1-4]UZQ33845.1 hypothetical protein SLV14N_000219 [Streptomyces sp. Je 1-4] [Streptomyces sp. Je 1-4 4N24]UZQ41263.1 hypothetical protein SLV14NA_000219 [Streptomyces sp. Je 1-4] [Streptomyces sp. Je 1-4 4N24_ara]
MAWVVAACGERPTDPHAGRREPGTRRRRHQPSLTTGTRPAQARGRTQEEVPYGDVERAAELPDGRLVPITYEDLERLPLPTRHVREVLGFVPGADIDPISYDCAYYAAPDGAAADRRMCC